MPTIILDEDLASKVATVASQLKISQQAVISHAIADYMEKIKQHQQLLAFAGILEESEADELLETIRQSRVNKETEFDL
jgi:predicted transcriptional regulator